MHSASHGPRTYRRSWSWHDPTITIVSALWIADCAVRPRRGIADRRAERGDRMGHHPRLVRARSNVGRRCRLGSAEDPARQPGESAVRLRESTSGSTTRPVACGCFPVIGLRQVSRARGGLRLRPGSPPTWRAGTWRRVGPRPSARCGELERYLRIEETRSAPLVARSRSRRHPRFDGGLLEHQQHSTGAAPCALRECCGGFVVRKDSRRHGRRGAAAQARFDGSCAAGRVVKRSRQTPPDGAQVHVGRRCAAQEQLSASG